MYLKFLQGETYVIRLRQFQIIFGLHVVYVFFMVTHFFDKMHIIEVNLPQKSAAIFVTIRRLDE